MTPRRVSVAALSGVGIGATAVAVVSLGLMSLGARALLRRQAAVARRRIGKPLGELAPDADRVWRRAYDGEPVELLMVGDSIAAGLGASRRKDTLGARIAKGLARHTHRPVRLRTAAVVGAESSMLSAQLDALPDEYRPDVAVVVVGGNDITHRVPVATSTAHLERAIVRLRGLGAVVVVGTCPDLGALRPVPQPLRSLGARQSRQLAAAQAAVAETAGARAVSLRRAVGPTFISQPDEMFSLDRFHPSALGYRRTAEALIPSVAAALDASVTRRFSRT
ncbi:MAG TPA: SGNH/GDSL hydrolase family protein [Microbacterium sp.]|uniref:SGNH/GDSL hydrolase family protein n=1 Tax=Microbacterium sp. TaxID=51671 RepID=UPI002D0C9C54|nr:SGNH/GDSL hydrolase family protein [Microbacterium sp.]HWI32560.1 SGNH/GDSL hydrolase family protein [Microbacterium sp.]